jgi:hypothetical protein
LIFLELFRLGLFRSLDREKLAYLMGCTGNPLYLSHRTPLIWRIHPLRLLTSRRYARGVAEWLRYRADLYDGRQG